MTQSTEFISDSVLFQVFTNNLTATFLSTKGVERQAGGFTKELILGKRNSVSISGRNVFADLANYSEKEDEGYFRGFELRFYLDWLVWGEYFNSLKKCWEPLVEPCSIDFLYEKVPLLIIVDSSLLTPFRD